MLKLKQSKIFIKATLKNLTVAFIYTATLFLLILILFKNPLNNIANTINMIEAKTDIVVSYIKLDLNSGRVTTRPNYKEKYAELKIDSLNISLPVYYGDALSILKNGIGHSTGSYLPGEGGRILYMGHNNKGILSELKNINIGAVINVTTIYGTFNYKVYATKIINYQDLDAVPINKDEEILMLYTCYQNGTIGHTPYRFVVYAKLDKGELWKMF